MTRFSSLIILAGFAVVASSFLFPETPLSMFLDLLGIFIVTVGSELAAKRRGAFFLGGVLLHTIGFFWLPETISRFGGFPVPVAWVVFFAYALLSSVQFYLCGLLVDWAVKRLEIQASFALGLSWFVTEFAFPRYFPWALSHPLIVWQSYALVASLVGVYLLSALPFLWFGSVIAFVTRRPKSELGLSLAALSLAVVVGLGTYLGEDLRVRTENAPQAHITWVQGGMLLPEGQHFPEPDSAAYDRLSTGSAASAPDIVLWPESSVDFSVSETARQLPAVAHPWATPSAPLLFGGASVRREQGQSRVFNSAILVEPDGKVEGMYHKQVLMPFGEYLPLETTFPWLRNISPYSGNLAHGDRPGVLSFAIHSSEKGTQGTIGLLICYEDLLAWLARARVQEGADVLINLTNDIWYGSYGASAHHLLAMWRAVETARVLVRVTTTGISGIVTPFGATEQKSGFGATGAYTAAVPLYSHHTFYVKSGDSLNWLLTLALVIWALYCARLARRRETRSNELRL